MQHMEDKLRLLSSAKDEVQQVNSQQACVISELQTKNNSLSMSVENLKRQIESMQQVLSGVCASEALYIHIYYVYYTFFLFHSRK